MKYLTVVYPHVALGWSYSKMYEPFCVATTEGAPLSTSDRVHTRMYDRGKCSMPSGEERIEKEWTNQLLSNFY